MNTHDIDRLIDRIEASPAMDIAGRSKHIHDLRAAIEADRQRRGELVGHVVQPSPAHFPGVYWLSEVHDGMELYTAPQPAEPVKVPSDEEIEATAERVFGEGWKFDRWTLSSNMVGFARDLLARYGQPDDQMFRDLEARVQSLDAECARLEAENDKLRSAALAQAQPAGADSLEVLRRVWQPHTQSNVDRMSEEDIAEEIASEVNRRWADEQPAARAAKEQP